MADAGRVVLLLGLVLVLLGASLMFFGRFHLPGDLTFRAGNVTIFIPLATSIIVSIVLTVALNLFLRQR